MKWGETQYIWSKSAYITNERLRTLFSVKMVRGEKVNYIHLLVTLRCLMAKEKIAERGGGGGGGQSILPFLGF